MKWSDVVEFFDRQRKIHYYTYALTKLEELPEGLNFLDKYVKTAKATPYFLIDNSNAPVIFIDKELLEVMLHTDISKDICQSIKQIYPDMVLMLPQERLIIDNVDISAIYIKFTLASNGYKKHPLSQPANYEKNTLYSAYPIKDVKIDTKETQLNIVAFARDSTKYLCGTIALDPSKDDYLNLASDTQNKNIAEALRAIVIQAYLIMEHKPEMATESCYKPQTKQENRQCRLNPLEATRWLGKNYSLRKEYNQKEASSFGTKQKIYWRRGHWRQQRYGSKDNPTIKTIWIEPYLVGIDKSALVTA